MKQFVFAFPLKESIQEAPEFLKKLHINACKGALIIPGISIPLEAFLQSNAESLPEIFEEHCPISEEEKSALSLHRSIFFLKGTFRNIDDLGEMNKLVEKFFAAGALGVYAEHSGAALCPDAFLEALEISPLEPWLNFIEHHLDLFTLGLESYGLPDFCLSLKNLDVETAKNHLSAVAEMAFSSREKIAHSIFQLDETTRYSLQKLSAGPFKKNSPEENKRGAFRLIAS